MEGQDHDHPEGVTAWLLVYIPDDVGAGAQEAVKDRQASIADEIGETHFDGR